MARDSLAVPHWPRWYCSRFLDHWGYLEKVRQVDAEHFEYRSRSCGWSGIRKPPTKKIRGYWF
jgi:hypothetical protein